MTTDLSDITFMIPVKIDSDDRIMNLNIVTMYLRHHFNTNIIIAEQGNQNLVPNILGKMLYNTYIHYKMDGNYFHKTRLINVMVKHAKTPYVAMCDSDVLCEPHQYISAANELRGGRVDFIYPFNGMVVNIVKPDIPKVLETLRFDFVRQKFTNRKDLALGGCVMYNRNKFIEGGLMNEHFISYGPEDGEQDMRLKKLGYRTNRINNPLFHLDHIRTENSKEDHQYSSQNWQEFKKIKNMNRTALEQYIKTWAWIK